MKNARWCMLVAAVLLLGVSASTRAGYINYVPMEFDVYLQQGAIEGNTSVNGAGIAGPYGEFVRSIPLGSPLARVTEYPDHIRFEADDVAHGDMGDADIAADIYFMDGLPTKVTVVQGSGAGSQSATWRYIYDFKVDGKLVVSRWQTHYGETVYLPPMIVLRRPSTVPQWGTWAVNTQGSAANVDLTIHASPSLDTMALVFGDGEISNFARPFPATLTHSYTLPPGENVGYFNLTALACNPDLAANDEESVTVLRGPDAALRIDGSSVFGGDTIQVEAGHLVLLSLADSQGYIESATFWISGKLDSRGHDLRYAAVLFGEWDIGQTYPLTVTVSNTGLGVNSDSMTVDLLVVPEPATLGLLAVAACCLVRRRRGCKHEASWRWSRLDKS